LPFEREELKRKLIDKILVKPAQLLITNYLKNTMVSKLGFNFSQNYFLLHIVCRNAFKYFCFDKKN